MYLFALMKPTDIDGVDAWLQSVGWENMAFVFLNHYLDLSEVCDDAVAIGSELCDNLIIFHVFYSSVYFIVI